MLNQKKKEKKKYLLGLGRSNRRFDGPVGNSEHIIFEMRSRCCRRSALCLVEHSFFEDLGFGVEVGLKNELKRFLGNKNMRKTRQKRRKKLNKKTRS